MANWRTEIFDAVNSIKNNNTEAFDFIADKLNERSVQMQSSHDDVELTDSFTYNGSDNTFQTHYAGVVKKVYRNGVRLLQQAQYRPIYKGVEILDTLELGDVIQIDYSVSTKNTQVYGVQINQSIAAPEVKRIGNMDCHKTLPVQSSMKRCLLNDDYSVNYYLDPNDSTKKEDGTTANLTGADGQVVVEIPIHWRRFECVSVVKNIWNAWISLQPFSGAHEVRSVHQRRPLYISAYKSSLDRVNNKLASVCNTSNDFRGGNNQSSWDNTIKDLRGKPVTQKDRIQFHQYALNRGADGWNEGDYIIRKAVSWLITIEYATRHHQAAQNDTLTPEGFKQGALGVGATDLSSGDWSSFNSYFPLFNCGLTNSLGNSTGEVAVVLQDFPTTGNSRTTQVMSYRGIESFFGDIWEWTNGININEVNGDITAYIRVNSEVSPTGYQGYRPVKMAKNNGYISQMAIGELGDIVPVETQGASSTTYWTDYFWYNSGFRGLLCSGASNTGALAGSFASRAFFVPAFSNANFGSRLCVI